jgi:hypothetical protein
MPTPVFRFFQFASRASAPTFCLIPYMFLPNLVNSFDKELVYRLKIEHRVLNERHFGRGYESKYWTLDVLVTYKEYQHMRLGSSLVNWGLERVEEKCRKRK